jgi:hypothetical protein
MFKTLSETINGDGDIANAGICAGLQPFAVKIWHEDERYILDCKTRESIGGLVVGLRLGLGVEVGFCDAPPGTEFGFVLAAALLEGPELIPKNTNLYNNKAAEARMITMTNPIQTCLKVLDDVFEFSSFSNFVVKLDFDISTVQAAGLSTDCNNAEPNSP